MLPDSSPDPSPDPSSQQRLRELRPLLLSLHKELMEQQRLTYEQTYGPIASKGEYFQLVLGHEWFDWLRPISQLIVRIDERLSAKKPDVAETPEGLLADVRKILNPLENGSNAEQRYDQAIQQNPDIALMHAKVVSILYQP
jgi:hypothetical protein